MKVCLRIMHTKDVSTFKLFDKLIILGDLIFCYIQTKLHFYEQFGTFIWKSKHSTIFY